MIGLAFKAFGAAGLLTKLITIGVLLASLLTAYGVWHHKVYRSGYTRAIADIAAEDEKAIARATEKRSVWSDCRARNGRWDQSTGTCS